MKNKKSKIIITIVTLIITCSAAAAAAIGIYSSGADNQEDKMLKALVGKKQYSELENREYRFRRIYTFKDGYSEDSYDTGWQTGSGS